MSGGPGWNRTVAHIEGVMEVPPTCRAVRQRGWTDGSLPTPGVLYLLLMAAWFGGVLLFFYGGMVLQLLRSGLGARIKRPFRCRGAAPQHLSQGQNLALTFLYVP